MGKSGFVKLKCSVISPSLKWLKEHWDPDMDEEPNYHPDEETFIIDMFLEDVDNNLYKYSITLENEEIISKSGANLYVNSTADLQWVQEISQLFSNFIAWEKVLSWKNGATITERWTQGSRPHEKEVIKDKEYRKAIKGEPELVDYAKAFYNHSPYDTEVDLLPNLKNLFAGKSKYLKNLISDDYSVVGFVYVENGKEKVYKHFLPKATMVWINQGMKPYNLDKSLKKQYEQFTKDVEHDLNGLDYELQKLGNLSYIKPVVTETNGEY